ncbi:YciK family oxidoreductase [Echinimonas agarilytica]|uniref:YciK family oxidoreductase n=1 Tax=Echinimonas agarilytica TaxID=1215918 RepID=A0AA42B7C3_9GAMM|nr:YciK family oxidoreductase [Echinimonas agarilytica]MCM2679750.1 YciK family oxidoreductase [Echinimonas agarilytica]
MQQYQVDADALNGKIILVTGAGDGIGKQAAISYAEHGATVVLLGRTVAKLEATYDEIVALGAPQPAIIPLDLQGATEKHYEDMASTIESTLGRLDAVLHSAGELGVLSTIEQTDLESFEKVMKVNVTSHFMMTKALLPLIKKSEQGRIVFTSSSVGKKGRAFWSAYAISKFATEGLMQTLADEMSNTRVRVNCINPGATRTAMRARAYPAEETEQLKTPLDLMPLYLYLMSDQSADINGQSIDAQPK